MTRRYEEIMDHVRVDGEMRSRILAHVSAADLSAPAAQRTPFPRRWLAAVACLTLLAVGGVVLPRVWAPEEPQKPPVAASRPPMTGTPNVGVVPGMMEVETVEALEEVVGFPVERLPLEGKLTCKAYGTTVAEIRCEGAEGTTVLRKWAGSEDNSGDYGSYAQTAQITVGDWSVQLKGNESGYVLGQWSDQTYSWSLKLPQAMDEAGWADLIENMHP